MFRNNLPDKLTLKTGEVLKPVIGGHLEGKPFLTVEHSGVDVTRNGWLNTLPPSDTEERLIIAEARRQRRKYRRLSVMSRNLRGKLDLHRRPYRPTYWVFAEVKTDHAV